METIGEELIGLDVHSRLISFERLRILRSAGGTSVTQKDYFQRNLFYYLKDRWIRDTINYSSTEDIFNHPACQMITERGEVLVPYILEDIENSPYRWIAVLRIITNENPILEEHVDDIQAMVNDWKEWGKRNGI